MCGIYGSFTKDPEEALDLMKHRGMDGKHIVKKDGLSLGHRLHAIVNHIAQPLEGKGIFAANCEIYNWKELNKKYNLNAKNDAEVIFKLLEENMSIQKLLEELDGVYAFAYYKDKTLTLTRDILGVKPLFYNDNLDFASEKKAIDNGKELNPRKILIHNTTTRLEEKPFFTIQKNNHTHTEIKKKVDLLFKEAVKKRIPNAKVGVLFSGGIDSTIIAKTLQDLNIPFTCYTAGFKEDETKEPDDIKIATQVAKDLNFPLKKRYLTREEIPRYLKKIIPLIEDANVVKTGVALPFYVSCELAKKDNCKVIFSGLGSEEIFAGYERHKNALDINKECLSGLKMMYERDLYRDDVVTMDNQLELRLPFLDKKLVNYALSIPSQYKIQDDKEKIIIREVAKDLNIPSYVTERKKKAAQYGSRFDSAIKKLAKKESKAKYLSQFLPTHKRLGVLFSGGKDSCYALQSMQKQNYEISCLISLKSTNTSSYMFHTPNIDLVEMQAKAMGIPLLIQKTLGEKEKELNDLKNAMQKAKDLYQIDGIVTGALYSTYQRDRIEKLAEELQLQVFNPLWHIDQEQEMRNIVDEGFEIILSSIAAYGLNKDWLGKVITHKDIDKLVQLNQKIGINIAGEGGEFESLVINAPFFKKRIVIKDANIHEVSENEAFYSIKDAKLI